MQHIPISYVVAVSVLLVMVFVQSGLSIKCSQCNSDLDPNCFRSTSPENCGITSSHCLTVRKYQEGTNNLLTVTRSCVPVHLGAACRQGQIIGGQKVTVCHETCNKSGCNNGFTPVKYINTFCGLFRKLSPYCVKAAQKIYEIETGRKNEWTYR